jgi:2-(1,2-epoxy-1,2-dihydrophenyl)acetyl-CoA isomerase
VSARVRLEPDEGVLRVVLDDPDAGNVIGRELVAGLLAGADAASGGDVRCLLLTSAGPNFCMGGDIRYFSPADGEAPGGVGARIGELAGALHLALRRLRDVPVPVVTAVRGWSAGAGIGLALSGDVVLLSSSARMRPGYAGLGFAPDGGVSWRLTRGLGPARAADLLLTNGILTAADALAAGLVSRVVPDDELDAAALELARSLAAGPTRALVRTRDLVRAAAGDAGLDAHLDAEAAAIAASAGEPDGLEGVAAFLSKRRPSFTGARS